MIRQHPIATSIKSAAAIVATTTILIFVFSIPLKLLRSGLSRVLLQRALRNRIVRLVVIGGLVLCPQGCSSFAPIIHPAPCGMKRTHYWWVNRRTILQQRPQLQPEQNHPSFLESRSVRPRRCSNSHSTITTLRSTGRASSITNSIQQHRHYLWSNHATRFSSSALACAAQSSSGNSHRSHPSSSPAIMKSFKEDFTSRREEAPETATDYEIWVRRLYETNMFHPVKLGLENIERIHTALGCPLDKTIVIHVAGSNGKGSVTLKIANTIRYANPQAKVGIFISPHIASFRERMQVNGELITESEVVELLPRIYQICQDGQIPATFFEVTTALACAFYALRGVDVVVLETGLGGRLDATNVVKAPALSVITSIGLEHTKILGDTVELIAKEKAGIMKSGCPVLVGPNVPQEVLRQCAREKGASQYYTCEDVLGSMPGPEDVGVLGSEPFLDYDVENSRIASAAMKLIGQSHPHLFPLTLTEEMIQSGTAIRPPCRFEIIRHHDAHDVNDVMVILDVAHNPPAMKYLVQKLLGTYPHGTFRIVVGMSSDKDLASNGTYLLEATRGDATRIHLVQAAHPRAALLDDILRAIPSFVNTAHYDREDPSVTKQISTGLELAKRNNEILVICGSVFLMAESREALGMNEPRDSPYIAAMAGAGFRYAQENFNSKDTK